MATELDKSSLAQMVADATGFVIDRAQYPEKVVGQCWLISKGRVATLASSVANYSDAAWALQIKFPHPDLNYGVRTVTLHPDFNKRDARDYYLAQARGPMPPPALDNDIATIALDTDLSSPPAERVAELNRALQLPFEISPQDMSGTLRSGDVPAILQSILSTGRSGLLTFMDSRNLPYCRISVRQTRIIRAVYQGLYNEPAMCELIWRQPPGSFAFQPTEYRWPADVPEITTPTEQLMMEAHRRFEELPRMIELLGGFDARFTKVTTMADFSQIHPSERMLADRVWDCLDSFITLNKLPERVCSDSYSTTKLVWDFCQMGLCSPNLNPVFHCNGQLGAILMPAVDVELSTWEPLTACYLDPLSGAPLSGNGNFFGGAHVLANKTLLHTIGIGPNSMGAAILKEGKLVGLHTGPYIMHGILNPPPIPLQRMIWVGAINDLGTKRLRTAEVAAAEAADAAESQQEVSARTSMRMRALSDIAHPDHELALEPETGPLAKYSKQQIAGAAAVVAGLGLIMMLSSLFAPHPPAASNTAPGTTGTSTAAAGTSTGTSAAAVPAVPNDYGDPIAAQVAEQMLGLKVPPASYKFVDSSKETEPKPSFKLVSESKNVDIIFIEWPNQSVLLDPSLITKQTPVYHMWKNAERGDEFKGLLPSENVYWFGNHCSDAKNPHGHITVTTGVFDPNRDGKVIVFVAKPVTEEQFIDMEYPAHLVEQCIAAGRRTRAEAEAATKSETAKPETAATTGAAKPAATHVGFATDEDLAQYRRKLEAAIQANYKPPKYDLDTNTKVAVRLTVDDTGEIKDLALEPNPDENFNGALQKAISKSRPWPLPPKTKSHVYSMIVRAHANDISVEEQ